jgi:hypothetical protein
MKINPKDFSETRNGRTQPFVRDIELPIRAESEHRHNNTSPNMDHNTPVNDEWSWFVGNANYLTPCFIQWTRASFPVCPKLPA